MEVVPADAAAADNAVAVADGTAVVASAAAADSAEPVAVE